jgi:hypothetical protein
MQAKEGTGRNVNPPGQSPEGHPVTLVGSVLGGPWPFAAAFRQAGRPGPGGIGAGKQALPTVRQDLGLLESRGWRREFTSCSQFFIPTHPRRRTRRLIPCRDVANHQGQEWGRGATRGTCRTGWALRRPGNRANPGLGPKTRFRRLPWSIRILIDRPVKILRSCHPRRVSCRRTKEDQP